VTTSTTSTISTTSTPPDPVRLPLLGFVLGMGMLALGLSPLLIGAPMGADLPIHRSDIEAITAALRAGDLQLWLMNLGAGHPAGLTAPLLPPLLAALTSLIMGVSTQASLSLWVVLGLLGTPVSAAWGAQLAGLNRARSLAVGAAVALLTSTSPWGLGPATALYAGLLAQVVAGLVWPLALGATLGAVRGTVAPGWAVVAVVVASACHPMSALFIVVGAGVAVVGAWLTRRAVSPARLARLVAGGLVAGLPLFVPGLFGASHWGGFEERAPGDRGDVDVVFLLLRGLLTDYERAPVLLVAALAACVLVATHRASPWRHAVAWCAGTGTVAALLVGVGPSLSEVVPWGRFLALLQLATAGLAGLAPTLLIEAIQLRSGTRDIGVVSTVVAAVAVGGGFIVGGVGLVRHTSALATQPAAVDDAVLAAEREALAPLRRLQPHPRIAALPLESISALELTRPFIDDGVPALFVMGGPAYQSSPLRGVTTQIEARHARLMHVGAILSRDDTGTATVTLTDAGPLCEGFDVAGHIDDSPPDAWRQAVHGHLAGPHAGVLVRQRDAVVVDAEGSVRTDTVALEPSQVAARVEVTGGRSLLVCKVGFHPWWQATIDGADAPVVVASPRFTAVVVPPGLHQVSLRFIRPWWLWLLWLGLPLAVVVAGRSSRGDDDVTRG